MTLTQSKLKVGREAKEDGGEEEVTTLTTAVVAIRILRRLPLPSSLHFLLSAY